MKRSLTIRIALLALLRPPSLSFGQDNPRIEAAALEKAGDAHGAAAAYEQIVRDDPATRPVLATRIARLYAEAGVTNQALEWAAAAAEQHPDPQAFLAGIHEMLGDAPGALAILIPEIARAEDPGRKIALLWLAADVCRNAGLKDQAVEYLQRALDAAQGRPEEERTRKKLANALE